MENKIQELADKIYHDGVEKGNIEADKIVRQAQEEASSIIENAHKVADSIVNAARKEAYKLSENAKSDLHLYAEQAVNALKSEVATLLTDKIVRSDVKKLFSDENFLHSLILAMAKNWLENEPVVISTQDAEKLNAYFLSEAKDSDTYEYLSILQSFYPSTHAFDLFYRSDFPSGLSCFRELVSPAILSHF